MSPEQAEGRKLDSRSDIFSFGTVLYEMSTGRRPFLGDSRLAVLNRIVNDEPPPPSQITPVPGDFEKLILRCLRKDPSRRYQTMADLRVALEDLETETSNKSAPLVSGIAVRRIALYAALGAVAVALAFLGSRALRKSPAEAPLRTVKFTITPAQLMRGGENEIDADFSISRDGTHIAYVESQGKQLWVRDIDQEQARPVPGAVNVYQTFWSTDSQSIGYSSGLACGARDGCDLVRIPVQGGTPVLVAKLKGPFRRAWWSSDGESIVFCDTTGMYTVPARGGSPTLVLAHSHIEHPSFLDLPDGRHAFLFQAVDPGRPGHGICLQMMGEDQHRLIKMSASNNPYPVYSATGHIIYVDGSNESPGIWALPFSLATLQATGTAFPIAQRGGSPVVSSTGTLVYSDIPSNLRQLTWVDRSGGVLSVLGEPQLQNRPILSPDGRRLAVEIRDGGLDLWVYDLERGVKTRFTRDSSMKRLGGWTPSGDRITYSSPRNGTPDIFSKAADGNGEATPLVATPLVELNPDWSTDQRFLIYTTFSRETKGDLLYRERRNDGSLGDAVVFLKTAANEDGARFPPDGRFVLYSSDESGREEVYALDFPKGAHRWQISSGGGTAPRWRHDGKEIFYAEGRKLMSVNVAARPDFAPGAPALLFEKRGQTIQYDVTPDGKRFIILEKPTGEPPLAIHVAHNWYEEFRGKQGAPQK